MEHATFLPLRDHQWSYKASRVVVGEGVQTLHYPECLLNGDSEAEDRAMASSDPFVSPHHVEELDKG